MQVVLLINKDKMQNCTNVFLTTPSLHLTWKSLHKENIVIEGCAIYGLRFKMFLARRLLLVEHLLVSGVAAVALGSSKTNSRKLILGDLKNRRRLGVAKG